MCVNMSANMAISSINPGLWWMCSFVQRCVPWLGTTWKIRYEWAKRKRGTYIYTNIRVYINMNNTHPVIDIQVIQMVPTYFFGHSLGAIIAFEVLMLLEKVHFYIYTRMHTYFCTWNHTSFIVESSRFLPMKNSWKHLNIYVTLHSSSVILS